MLDLLPFDVPPIEDFPGSRAGLNLTAATTVAAASFHGVENPPDVAGHRLEPSVMLLHPGENLANLPPVLFQLSIVSRDIVMVSGDDISQVPDNRRHNPNLTTEVVDPRSNSIEPRPHFGKPGGSPIHVVPEDLGEALQRQPVVRISHRPPPSCGHEDSSKQPLGQQDD
jgi:hypothetical protein